MISRISRTNTGSQRGLDPRCRGMSLFELMIVIVMIGIISTIALTHLDWKRYQADAAGRGTMAELAMAQRLALSLQSNVVVTFPDSAHMRILEDANNDGAPTSGERIRYVSIDNGFAFGKGTAPDLPAPADPTVITSLTFHRDGSADKNGTLYMHGPPGDPTCGHCRAISVARATGRVNWYSYSSGTWRRAN